MARSRPSPDALFGGDRVALARAISHVENDAADAVAILDACFENSGRAFRIGITGPPGAGKSTLVTRLAQRYRKHGETVAIVAVDPTSPFSGGALLGDRVRMGELSGDPGVFIRSMATRGSLGGLAVHTAQVCDVLDAAGYQRILIETVGVGQSELEVAQTADSTAVVLVPESGDGVQAMKAGILEVADVLVVNKADLPGAGRTVASLEAAGHGHHARIVQTVATTGAGVDGLLAAVHHCERRGNTQHERHPGRRRVHRDLAEVAANLVRTLIETSPAAQKLCDDVAAGQVDLDVAARDALRIVVEAGR